MDSPNSNDFSEIDLTHRLPPIKDDSSNEYLNESDNYLDNCSSDGSLTKSEQSVIHNRGKPELTTKSSIVNPTSSKSVTAKRFEIPTERSCAPKYSAWNDAINKVFQEVASASTSGRKDNNPSKTETKAQTQAPSDGRKGSALTQSGKRQPPPPQPALSGVVRSSSYRGPNSTLSTSMTKLAGLDPCARRASGSSAIKGSPRLGYRDSYGYPSPSITPTPSEIIIQDPLSLKRQLSCVGSTTSKLSIPGSRPSSIRSASDKGERFQRVAFNRESLVRCSSYYRTCRSNSFAFSMDGNTTTPLRDLPPKERRHRKVGYAIVVVSSILLLLAVLMVVVSLHWSSGPKEEQDMYLGLEDMYLELEPPVNDTMSKCPRADVRKENEDLLRGVIHTPSTLNNISLSSSTPASLDNYQQENIVLSRSINGGGGSEANLILPPSSRSDLTIPKNSTISSYASPLSQHLLGSRK